MAVNLSLLNSIPVAVRNSYSVAVTLSNPGVILPSLFCGYDEFDYYGAVCSIGGVSVSRIFKQSYSYNHIVCWGPSSVLGPGSYTVSISNMRGYYETWGAIIAAEYSSGKTGTITVATFTGYTYTFTVPVVAGKMLVFFERNNASNGYPYLYNNPSVQNLYTLDSYRTRIQYHPAPPIGTNTYYAASAYGGANLFVVLELDEFDPGGAFLPVFAGGL